MIFEMMDVCNMSYKDEEFDVVLDKGTLDALLYDKDYNFTDRMLKEMKRVMKK